MCLNEKEHCLNGGITGVVFCKQNLIKEGQAFELTVYSFKKVLVFYLPKDTKEKMFSFELYHRAFECACICPWKKN